VEGGASGLVGVAAQGGGVLTALNQALGLAKAPAAAQVVPSDTALSMPMSAWNGMSKDTQSLMVAANPHGIHLTVG
jgi:hypothetical protein